MKRLLQHPATQAALAWLAGLYLLFALRTTHWVLDGAEHMAPHVANRALVAAFWHERLPLMPMLWLKARRMNPAQRMNVLISLHRDGQLIASVMRRFGVATVFGSSRRGGAAGMRAALPLLARGEHLVITPDGPRGPRRVAAAGVAQVAALSGAPVLPCAAQTSRRRVLRSWDRMVVPLPFGRGVLVCLPAISVPRDGWQDALPEIAAALTAAADRADRLCGA
jgi:lysophospholipid acyltransferase (LPLAT)-like uncharacterized protein